MNSTFVVTHVIDAVPATIAALVALRVNKRTRHVQRGQGETRRTLGRIERQTNGDLTARVRAAVEDTIRRHPNLVTEETVAEVLHGLVKERLEDTTTDREK